MANISSNKTLNNQGEPPEVIDNTQESPSTITNPSGIILDENGKKQSLIFLPILTSHRICLISLRLLIYSINPIVR